MIHSLDDRLKVVFFLALMLFAGITVRAGRIERAYEALEVYNLHDAERLFRKTLKRHGTAAAYGLAVMYQDRELPVFQKDSAYKYIVISDSLYPETKDRRKRRYAELNVTPESIDSLKLKISSLFFEEIENAKDPAVFQAFIDRHPWAIECEKAVDRRNALAFQSALDTNTHEAYARFIERYPDSKEADMARAKYEERFFEAETKGGTIESYREFIEKNPGSDYVYKAHEMLYHLSTEDETAESYVNYLLDYADSPFRDRAWRRLFELEIVTFAPEELEKFKRNFPNYPFKDELNTFIDRSRKELIPVRFESGSGFIDAEGETVINDDFDWLESFKEGKAAVGYEGKAGFLNIAGKWHVNPRYDEVYSFAGGKAVVEKDGKYGVVNHWGKELIPPEFIEVGEYVNGRIPVLKDSLYGYMDEDGELVIPYRYLSAYDFKNGYARVRINGGWGLIDVAGNPVLTDTADALFDVQHMAIRVVKNDTFALYSITGDTLLPPEFEMISEFTYGLAIAARDGKYVYVDPRGKPAFDEEFDYKPFTLNYAMFENGYAKYMRDGKFGMIDTAGNRVFPAMFDEIGTYSPDLTPVRKKDKWGYADSNVQLKIKYKYDYARPFVDSLARVRLDGKTGLINRNAEFVLDPQFDKMELFNEIYITELKGEKGVTGIDGREIFAPVFDEIDFFKTDFLILKIGRSSGVYSLKKHDFIYVEPGFTTLLDRRSKPEDENVDDE